MQVHEHTYIMEGKKSYEIFAFGRTFSDAGLLDDHEVLGLREVSQVCAAAELHRIRVPGGIAVGLVVFGGGVWCGVSVVRNRCILGN
jgi:hypothetical protein